MKSPLELKDLVGKKITVMGLGLNGGGVETCRFLARHGAKVTVTDLKSEEALADSMAAIEGLGIRMVLGKHEPEDFAQADMVIKNPAVRPNNPYVALAKHIETDLSLFCNFVKVPIIGVTGSKGKSTVSSAIYHGLLSTFPKARIGGNITISPLSFFEDLDPNSPLVLELSSFQLGDISRSKSFQSSGRLQSFPPPIAIMTSIFHDHQDYYGAMEPYLADKAVIFKNQSQGDHFIHRSDDEYGPQFAKHAHSTTWGVSGIPGQGNQGTKAWVEADGSGWMKYKDTIIEILPRELAIQGGHHRANLLQAACALVLSGVDPVEIRNRLGSFSGIEHRLETCGVYGGITFINDSAATIPEAALSATCSVKKPLHLICGGNDKNLDLSPFLAIPAQAVSITLLKGTASDKICAMFNQRGIPFNGPFDDLRLALKTAITNANGSGTIMLSPGSTSFGMFANEFDRGRKYKALVTEFIEQGTI